MEIVDISVPVGPRTPTWPGSVGVRLTRTMRLEAGDEANVSRLDTDVHVGTHVDAPWHFLRDGGTVEQLALDVLIGPAVVSDVKEVAEVTAAILDGLALPPETRRLLLRTRNSRLWEDGATAFTPDFVALTADAARWIVARGIRLVGIDYLSIQRFRDPPETHAILLRAGVVVLETLNLSRVQPGPYELICLPLLLSGAEAAPARTVLRRLDPSVAEVVGRRGS